MRTLSTLIIGPFLVVTSACSSKEAPVKTTSGAPVTQSNKTTTQAAQKQKQEELITYSSHPERFTQKTKKPEPYKLNLPDPKTAQEHFTVAVYKHDRRDLDGAIDEYKKALALKPDWAIAHFRLARAYQEKGDIDAAMAQWKETTRADPHYYEAFTNLATAYKEKGDLKNAAESYEKVLEFPPSRMAVHYRLGFWYRDLGEKEKARQHLESYIDLALNGKSKEPGTDRYEKAVRALQALK
jgi:tetratricopeptide (TPR) repeat protein